MLAILLIQMIWTFLTNIMENSMMKLFIMNYDRPLCPNCNISMNSNGSRRAKPTNRREYVKNNIFVRFVGKHITQVWKILSKDIPIILWPFAVKH